MLRLDTVSSWERHRAEIPLGVSRGLSILLTNSFRSTVPLPLSPQTDYLGHSEEPVTALLLHPLFLKGDQRLGVVDLPAVNLHGPLHRVFRPVSPGDVS